MRGLCSAQPHYVHRRPLMIDVCVGLSGAYEEDVLLPVCIAVRLGVSRFSKCLCSHTPSCSMFAQHAKL